MGKRIAIILFALILSVSAYASEFTPVYNLEIPSIGARDWQPIISRDIISIDTVIGIISSDVISTKASDTIKFTILSNDAVIQNTNIQIISNDSVTQNIKIQILSNDAVIQNNLTTMISGDVALSKSPTYITQTANGQLTNEQAIGSLSSGIMRVANSTGVITSLTDILPIANGGTASAIGYTVVSNDISDLKARTAQVKGWATVTYSTGTPTLQDNYNVSGITDTAEGRITVTWDTDFANANYAIAGASVGKTGDSWNVNIDYTDGDGGLATTAAKIALLQNGTTLSDPLRFTVLAAGDQ